VIIRQSVRIVSMDNVALIDKADADPPDRRCNRAVGRVEVWALSMAA